MRDTPYCNAPWVGLTYESSVGCKPCCEWQAPDKDILSSKGSAFQGRYTDYIKSDWLKDFKKLMYEDEMSTGCQVCINAEEAPNSQSRRQDMSRFKFNEHGENYIARFDFRAGNKCNLSCRMCHPEASSMREEEEIARGNIQSIFRVEDMSDAYDIDLTKCKELSILGGEPSIDLEVRKWIDHVKDYDIDVCVTTNATNTSNKWFQTLKKLKNEPEIWLSIDAAGEVNDFQRKGSVWSSVKDNIIKYRDEFYEGSSKLSIQLTASAINFTTLDVWWDELMELNIPIHSSPVIHPVEYNLGAIPDKFKEAQVIWLDNWLLEKPRHWRQKREVKEAINILRSNPYSKEKQQLFKSEVTSLDSWRNESIIELDYRFKEILDA